MNLLGKSLWLPKKPQPWICPRYPHFSHSPPPNHLPGSAVQPIFLEFSSDCHFLPPRICELHTAYKMKFRFYKMAPKSSASAPIHYSSSLSHVSMVSLAPYIFNQADRGTTIWHPSRAWARMRRATQFNGTSKNPIIKINVLMQYF